MTTTPECPYCLDSTGVDECARTDDDWVIGWDAGRWFLVRESGADLSIHERHNDAVRRAIATDSTVSLFHEADGGGCLGEWDLSVDESPYDDEDNCY